MNVKFKKLNDRAVIPSRAHKYDAALDLVATSKEERKQWGYVEYGTGLAMEIPSFCVGLIFPRSSISKTCHFLRNSIGVIDSGYRGEIKLRFSIDNSENIEYDLYNKIGQLMIIELPNLSISEVSTLEGSERGGGGFGSTGI
tara:strand:- start:3831 stop:4256 length:426 start_codon:yes stop_codon:yes gene_type:complete